MFLLLFATELSVLICEAFSVHNDHSGALKDVVGKFFVVLESKHFSSLLVLDAHNVVCLVAVDKIVIVPRAPIVNELFV